MHRRIALAIVIALAVILVAVGVAATAGGGETGGTVRTTPEGRTQAHRTPTVPVTLDGVNAAVVPRLLLVAVHEANVRTELQAEIDRRAAAVRARGSRSYSGGAVTGSCAAMAPPGFPGYIVQRESGGDPNAVNRKSGALGCAQILPSHFGRSCAGMDYAQCWAALWDGGKGASHWACTVESGCRG